MGTEIRAGKLIKFDEDQYAYTVPDEVTEIAELAFSGAGDLEAVRMHDSVVSIGNYAFLNCYSLREVRLPERMDHVGTGLFQNCWKLRRIAFPEGLAMLGGEMLESCHALRAVYLPDSLEHLERTAFNTCRSLREVHISPERMHILPSPVRNIAVLTYMGSHDGDEPCEPVDSYAKSKQRLLIDLAVNRRDTDAVRYMLQRGLADPETVMTYLDKSAATSRVEITALLLDHERKNRRPDANGGGLLTDPVLSGDPFAE